MQTLAVLAQKGGVGKSMLARSLAVQGLLDGLKAAILDADPQGTVVTWGKRRRAEAPAVIPLGGQSLHDTLGELRDRGADLAIIDTPPHAQPLISEAAREADAAIVVTEPLPESLEQVGVVISILTSLGRSAGIVLNKVPPRSHALTLARAALTTFRVPVCPTAITSRLAHPYASAEGLVVVEREPGSRGSEEITEVWKWILTNILARKSSNILVS